MTGQKTGDRKTGYRRTGYRKTGGTMAFDKGQGIEQSLVGTCVLNCSSCEAQVNLNV